MRSQVYMARECYIEDFSEMDKDGIMLMFKSISCPGGFNINGNWNEIIQYPPHITRVGAIS